MKTTFLILFCSFSLSLFAQDKTAKNWKDKMHKNMPMMTKSVGVILQNFEGINSRLAAFPQYAPLKHHLYTISLGSMHVMNNFVSQMTLTGGSSLSGHRDEKSSNLRMIGGSFDLGYDVIPAQSVMLYPMAGIGVENYNAIFYKDVSAVDFDDVVEFPSVQNSTRSVKFTNTFAAYRLGLGIALKSPKGNSSIGIQAVYSGGFRDRNWKSSENQALANAPSDELHRFGVSLVFSGGMMGCMNK